MRLTRRSMGRNAEVHAIHVTHDAERSVEFTLERNLLHDNVNSFGRYSTMNIRSFYN
jgi:hypothetical protein